MRRRKYTKWSGDFPPHNSADWLAEGHVTLSAGAAGSVNVKPNWHAMRGKYRALPLGLGEAMIDAPVEVVRNSLRLGSVGSRVLGVTPWEEEPLASSHPPGWPLWSAPDRASRLEPGPHTAAVGKYWIKVKNRSHPAHERVKESYS